MIKGLELTKRQQPEIIDGFPTGNIFIGVTKEELAELEQELQDLDTIKEIFSQYGLEYKLTSAREALLLLKQYQGSFGVRGQALITKKLEALENISKAYGDYANHKISEYELIMTVGENTTY